LLDIDRRDSNDPYLLLEQPGIAPRIMIRPFDMTWSVDLDAQALSRTIEIENVGTEWVLAAKSQASLLPPPQQRPKGLLGLSHRAAKRSRPLLSQNG
jgi:hypothetical protein